MSAVALATKTETCDQVLIVHRFYLPASPGDWTDMARGFLYECEGEDCAGQPGDHEYTLPCRWSFRLAHGKAFGGRPFPSRRCPGCDHIRRAGRPTSETAA